MTSWAYVYDRSGNLLDEFDGTFRRSWGINALGQCNFALSVLDAKNTRANLEFGNYIVVNNNEGLPLWVGRMEPPRSWGASTTKHSAVTPEILFREMNGAMGWGYHLIDSPGGILRTLIGVINEEDDKLLREGDIIGGDSRVAVTIEPSMTLFEGWDSVLSLYRYEWDITPLIAENRLQLMVNLYDDQGENTNDGLNDMNCRIDEENSLTENGPIYNKIFLYSNQRPRRCFTSVQNNESIERYGERVIPVGVDTVSTDSLEVVGERMLRTMAFPRRTFKATASNIDGLYSRLRLGNLFYLESVKYGYAGQGIVGTQSEVRILGMAYNDSTDGVALTIEKREFYG